MSGGRECQREDTAQLEERYGYRDDGDDQSSLLEAAERRRRRGRMGEGVSEGRESLKTEQRNYRAFKLSYSALHVGNISRAHIPCRQCRMADEDKQFSSKATRRAPTASLVSIIKGLASRRVAG